MRGSAIYVTVDGIVRNDRYPYVPKLREEKPDKGEIFSLDLKDLLKLCPYQ
jgi:hypothetical protein